jgi:hypothetical protein
VIYELHLASARDERHAAHLTRLWELEVSLYVDLLEQAAAARAVTLRSSAREVAETVVALEDSFDLHLLARNAAIDRDLAVRRSHLASPPALLRRPPQVATCRPPQRPPDATTPTSMVEHRDVHVLVDARNAPTSVFTVTPGGKRRLNRGADGRSEDLLDSSAPQHDRRPGSGQGEED